MPIPSRMQGPVRITATLPRNLHERLIERSTYEGRSLSNLIAFLLESMMNNYTNTRK
jgi:hypothetical protein